MFFINFTLYCTNNRKIISCWFFWLISQDQTIIPVQHADSLKYNVKLNIKLKYYLKPQFRHEFLIKLNKPLILLTVLAEK